MIKLRISPDLALSLDFVTSTQAILAQKGKGKSYTASVQAEPRIDHDHGTGNVRGVLCHACNVSLGLFGDDPVRLRRAADYLEAACVP